MIISITKIQTHGITWIHSNTIVPPIQYPPGGDRTKVLFGIGQPMTREYAVYSIMKAFFGGVYPDLPATFQNFKDSNIMDPSYALEINYAKYWGITDGYGDENFHPYDPISREMAAALINRAISPFAKTNSPGLGPFGY